MLPSSDLYPPIPLLSPSYPPPIPLLSPPFLYRSPPHSQVESAFKSLLLRPITALSQSFGYAPPVPPNLPSAGMATPTSRPMSGKGSLPLAPAGSILRSASSALILESRKNGIVVVLDGINEASFSPMGAGDEELEGVNPLIANPMAALVKNMMLTLPE